MAQGRAMSLFQASAHRTTISSQVLKTRLESQFWRMYCQTFSARLSSGDLGGSGIKVMFRGTQRALAVCQPDLLLGRQLRRRPCSGVIDQPVRTLLVEAMDPVAQRFPVHASHLGRRGSRGSVHRRRDRQQPTRLTGIAASRGQKPQLRARVITPHRNSTSHGKPFEPVCPLNHATSDLGIPNSESGSMRAGIRNN